MADSLQFDRIEVILVAPRNPLNIGAAARAMADFGFAHLCVVAPYEPHWREARSAIGADELLQNARCTLSLADAVAGCTLVLGTGTLTHRRPEQPVVKLPDLGPRIAAELRCGGRLALVFGSEKHGLSRDDLALCHLIAEIPTDPRQPSMNLGQAVAVCLYELAGRGTADLISHAGGKDRKTTGTGHSAPRLASPSADRLPDFSPAATAAELNLLAEVVAETMQAANYSPAAMRRANRHDLALLLRRLHIGRRDARRILGLFRRILWRLRP